MKTSLQGYNASYATFLCEVDAPIGKTVSIKSNHTVGKAVANTPFIGVLVSLRDGYGLVQTAGAVTIAYTGTAPTLGVCALASDGQGNVVANAAGKTLDVVAVDSTARTVTFIL